METEVLKCILREIDLFQEEAARHLIKISEREDEHGPGSELENASGRQFSRTLPERVRIFLSAAFGVPLLLAES